MALIPLSKNVGVAGSGAWMLNGLLKRSLEELRGLTTVVVDGAAANADVAVAGLGATDHIQSAILYTTGVPSSLTVASQTAGNFKTATDTSGKKIVVSFYKK